MVLIAVVNVNSSECSYAYQGASPCASALRRGRGVGATAVGEKCVNCVLGGPEMMAWPIERGAACRVDALDFFRDGARLGAE